MVVIALALGAGTAKAATIPVTTTADGPTPGACSLREAVDSANNDASTECVPGSGDDTIKLDAGHYVLSVGPAGENLNSGGDLDIDSSLAIDGAGALKTTIDAQHIDRVIQVLGASNAVTIKGLTITGGLTASGLGPPDATGGNAKADDASDGDDGGGIFSDGPLTIEDSIITGNLAGDGGPGGNAIGGAGSGNGGAGGSATAGFGGRGGGGAGIEARGNLTIRRSRISGNRTGDGGRGGNAVGGAGAPGTASTAGGAGGSALAAGGGSGGEGGAIESSGDQVTIVDSTISGNDTGVGGDAGTATGGAGGTGTTGSGAGGTGGAATGGSGGAGGVIGAIAAFGHVTISGSTITNNSSGSAGAAGAASGGNGGGAGSGGNQNGGDGGSGTGGDGGFGGLSSAIGAETAVDITNSTIDANTGGNGSTGGGAVGGNGGNGTLSSVGGHGGNAAGGDGGSAGGGALVLFGNGNTLQALTLTSNTIGAGGGAGFASPGAGGTGSVHGQPGNSAPGNTTPPFVASALVATPGTTIAGSIVAGNAAAACAGATDGGHNVTSDPGCFGLMADPELGPLQDNGGPTLTRAIAPDSPARDIVPAAGCPAADQRGVSRPQGIACDAGAFEVPGAAPLTSSPPQQSPQPPDRIAPAFRSASIRPSTFVVKKGTRFRYSLSERARVVFTIQHRVKCKSRRNRRHCTRFVRSGRFAVASKAGANVHRFSGRIGHKRLKPGRYRALLVATDAAGNSSKVKRLGFRVVRR